MLFPRFLILLILPLIFFGCREDSAPTENTEPVQHTEGTINVTSPTYSETWPPGTEHTIRWDFEQDITKVDILLYRKQTKIMTIASGVGNTSNYVWKVPTDINYSRHYRIKVVEALYKLTEDFSEYFYILDN